MKSYHVLLSVLALIGVVLLYAIWNVGLLLPVTIEQVNTPNMYLVYKSHMGPYHELGEVFEKVESQLAEKKIPCPHTFGRYYDNPDIVEHERLRADIGCVLEQPLTDKVEGLKGEELNSFPALKGTFEGAPWLTAFKVYSALRKESYQRNLSIEATPILEIYEKKDQGFKTHVFYKISEKFQ